MKKILVIGAGVVGLSVSYELSKSKKFNVTVLEKAKKIGFLSRAAYKLIEIDKKYKLILKSSDILELGASPGSWSQVIININDQQI